MQNVKKELGGFTLLEILIVVLVISVLAAIALPAYQKAVERARSVEAIHVLENIGKAYVLHYMQTGTWATSFDQLDIRIPWTGNQRFLLTTATDTKSKGEWSFQIENNGAYSVNLVAGRLTGPYKGTGFGMTFVVSSNTTKPMFTIYCFERVDKSNAVAVFDTKSSPGAYCQDIIHAKFAQGTDTRYLRMYPLH